MTFDYDILTRSEKIIYALRSLYCSCGYELYRMSKFEEYDLYSRNKEFLVSDTVITFTDTSGKLMALKPDVTLSLIKNNRDVTEGVQKLCYNENVYRTARGAEGFREIMQTGLECFGSITESCVTEVLLLAAKSLAALSSDYVLEISHLGILSRFLDALTPEPLLRQKLLKCVGEKNVHELKAICAEAELPERYADGLTGLLQLCGRPQEVLPQLQALTEALGLCADRELDELKNSCAGFAAEGMGGSLLLDFSSVGDMNYYNGILFKGYIAGIPESVLSGGRYDNLMRKLGRKAGAIGFAVYLDRLERLGGPEC